GNDWTQREKKLQTEEVTSSKKTRSLRYSFEVSNQNTSDRREVRERKAFANNGQNEVPGP
ncbi:hypothetical protein, partial [Staphylococcus aureus]|uniref:hypothetical protein n=1 Tax=Staphylococcus aureus TaxID=1280 RepID=UPI0038B2E0B2